MAVDIVTMRNCVKSSNKAMFDLHLNTENDYEYQIVFQINKTKPGTVLANN